MAALRDYVALVRPDHWFKNVLAIPGVVLAFALLPDAGYGWDLAWRIPLAAVSLCATASSNYVLNEILDAKYDRHHPTKSSRPAAAGRVDIRLAYGLWLAAFAVGLSTALVVGVRFAFVMLALWIMGIVYNVPPIRTKDVPYLDALSESVNNPLRLLAGWYAVLPVASLIPGSLLLAYWMGGAYLMTLKRFAELRYLGSPEEAAKYRPSFAHYTERGLLTAILFYGACCIAFLAAFAVRYRFELVLALPISVLAMAVYFYNAFQHDSPIQRPEALVKERWMFVVLALFVAVAVPLLFIDLPFLDDWLSPTAPSLVD